MAGTLLQIVQDSMAECGFRAPSGVASNPSDESQTLLRLANRAGSMIVDAFPWQALQEETSIALVTGTQSYAVPAHFLFYSPSTMWNRDSRRPVEIALTPTEWQSFKGATSFTGLNLRARIQDSNFVFEQPITAAENGQVIYYEFRTKAFCESSGGTPQQRFALDTDVSRLDRDLMSCCLRFLILKQRGLDYQADYMEYAKKLRTHMGNDNGARSLNLGGSRLPLLGINVPDYGYG